jgi:hypothetical protein
MAEVFVYPPIQWLTGFPSYRSGDWVNVSRHKFSGLVGHDLIWCLYCDWMTGIWSLGTEMLRNVESFWCPIRFSNTAKCDNCSVDFPDVKNEWVRRWGHGSGNQGSGADARVRQPRLVWPSGPVDRQRDKHFRKMNFLRPART